MSRLIYGLAGLCAYGSNQPVPGFRRHPFCFKGVYWVTFKTHMVRNRLNKYDQLVVMMYIQEAYKILYANAKHVGKVVTQLPKESKLYPTCSSHKILGISSTPPKKIEILTAPKHTPFCTLTLRKDPKMN